MSIQLFHAMMAISALSLATRNGLQSTNALEHYQQVITTLQQAARQNPSSDGRFFTHFLLLLYEVRAIVHFSANYLSINLYENISTLGSKINIQPL
jgi:serine phosphatase RsbU (regulator of sigma subunit)